MRHDTFLCLLDHRGPKFDFCLAHSHHPTPKFCVEIYFRYVNSRENYPPIHAKISSTNFASKTCFFSNFFFGSLEKSTPWPFETRLGFAVGYTLDAVGPIIIASIVSTCWFKEITGKRQLLTLGTWVSRKKLGSGQIIATSQDFTPNGALEREIPLFQRNLGWWNIMIWPVGWMLLDSFCWNLCLVGFAGGWPVVFFESWNPRV